MNEKASEIRKTLLCFPTTYAVEHEIDTTCGLGDGERLAIRDKLCDFIDCFPESWSKELKLRLLYSVITKIVKYDKRKDEDENPTRYTYMGVLETNAVCMGISEFFTLVCNNLGIKTYTIIGYGSKEYHAWNMVFLPNKYGEEIPLHFDATWDLGKNSFDYYLKNDRYMKKHRHTWIENRYPPSFGEAWTDPLEINGELLDFACNIFFNILYVEKNKK